ncbi:MAG: hypothetical protein WC009_11955, partial [Methylotenera sp.]
DISEALNAAIQNVKESSTFPQYVWRLDSIWGSSSGFIKVSLVGADTSGVGESLLSSESDLIF